MSQLGLGIIQELRGKQGCNERRGSRAPLWVAMATSCPFGWLHSRAGTLLALLALPHSVPQCHQWGLGGAGRALGVSRGAGGVGGAGEDEEQLMGCGKGP